MPRQTVIKLKKQCRRRRELPQSATKSEQYLLSSYFYQGRCTDLHWPVPAAAPPLLRECVGSPVPGPFCERQTPFLCPACYREQHEGEVNELKSTVEALRVEVAQLKELIHDLREEAGDPASKPHKPSTETPWNVVVRREKRHPRTKSKSPPKDSHTEPQPSHSSHHTHPSQQSRSKNRMPVKGARKIWGTLRHTTSFAIQNTLKALTKSGSNGLTVKRKFKTAPSDRNRVMKWWFVLRGEEQLLEQLQDEWPAVSTQTSWKLEPVLSYTTILDDPGTATAEQPMESGERSAVN